MNKWAFLARSMGLAYLPALSGVVAQPGAWYQQLQKPPLNPPDWVFAPAWTLLYTLMGLAHYEYCRQNSDLDKKPGQALYGLQLLLNASWSLVFFAAKSPRWALLNIVLLLVAILLTVAAFARVSRRSALLLLPYLLWVSFATYLNAGIVVLNQE